MNNNNSRHRKIIESFVGKGTLIPWDMTKSTVNLETKGIFKVTSLRLNSWGSIYINLSANKDSQWYGNNLHQEFTYWSNSKYDSNKQRERFKYCVAREVIHGELKLLGINRTKIFIKRLTFYKNKSN